MNRYYALINERGILICPRKRILTLKQMQNLVGVEGEHAYIEIASYRSYVNESITMICDEEFLRKDFQPTCQTIEGHILHGQVLVLATDSKTTESSFTLLTLRQVLQVILQTRLIHKGITNEKL